MNVLDIMESDPWSLVKRVLTLNPKFICISIPCGNLLSTNEPRLTCFGAVYDTEEQWLDSILKELSVSMKLLRWSRINYYDLDDRDYLEAFIGIFEVIK